MRVPTWTRKRGDVLLKRARMTDGEMLHLSAGIACDTDSVFDDKVYAALQLAKEAVGKALFWAVGATVFGILAHFRVLKSLSSNGLEVSPAVFSHTALIAIGVTTAWFCFSYSKLSFLQSWFIAKHKNAPLADRVRYLLIYPDAYWYFQLYPATIGYPSHIHRQRNGYFQLASIILLLIAILIFTVFATSFWFIIAYDVWIDTQMGKTFSIASIALSGTLVLLGWAAPFYYDFKRPYVHYGLSNLLTKLEGDDLKKAHLKIHAVATRMGLE
jgi:hypothetical protein